MRSSVAQWLASAERKISDAVSDAVKVSAVFSEKKLRSEVPSNRRKTKASVKHIMTTANSAKIGFFFSQKYTTNRNAFTYTMFRHLWRDKIRADAKAKFIETLNDTFQR